MNNLNVTNQKGDVLLEALISMVIMAVIVLGVAYMTTQASKNLSDTKANIYIVNQLKNKLASQTHDEICLNRSGTFNMPTHTAEIEAKNCDETIAVTITSIKKDDVALADVARPEEFAEHFPTQINAPLVFETTVNGLEYRVGGVNHESEI